MPANSFNRETTRDALATVLQTALVGAGLPCDNVWNYLRGDILDDSNVAPVAVAMVTSGPITRERATFDASWGVLVVALNVHVLVLYSSDDATETTAATWTEAMSEDRLDLIEKEIADALMDNYGAITGVDYVAYAGPTVLDFVPIGGRLYRREIISLMGVQMHG